MTWISMHENALIQNWINIFQVLINGKQWRESDYRLYRFIVISRILIGYIFFGSLSSEQAKPTVKCFVSESHENAF